jgi:hypothetical protein
MLDGLAASGTPQTVRASDPSGAEITLEVVVYDPAAARTVAELTPASQTIATGDTATLTVRLNLPAPSGGQLVTVSASPQMAVSDPMDVTVPAGEIEAEVTVDATQTDGTETITASIGGGQGAMADVVVTALPAECLIISEYVEGSSFDKAIELYNCGSQALDMSNFGMCRVTNENTACPTDGSKSATTAFSGMLPAGETFVVCHTSLSDRSNCDVENGGLINHSGDDRYIVFADRNNDEVYAPGTDDMLDSFGVIDFEPDDTWQDKILRRCNFTPFTYDPTMTSMVTFEYTEYFVEAGSLMDFSDLGSVTMMSCPMPMP